MLIGWVTAAEFYYMMARWLRFYHENNRAPNTIAVIRNIGAPSSPITGSQSETICQSEILNLSMSSVNSIDNSNHLTNFIVKNDGSRISPEALFWYMARTIKLFGENGELPNYTTVPPVEAPNL